MNRVDLLLRTPDVTLARFDHPAAAEHHDPEFEIAEYNSINFVEAGSFNARIGDREWRFEPGALLVTTQGMGFSYTHDHDAPIDRCLSITYAERAVEDLLVA